MDVSRRGFLWLAGAAGASFAGGCASGRLFTGGAAEHDPNLTVLMSDIHVNGQKEGTTYQRDKFAETVAEILRLDPLPARAVLFGDIAWLWGNKMDYECSAPYLKLLEDAGISVTIGMGNHDRRSAFLEVHPKYARSTKVPGRIVSVVDAGKVDMLMLDALQGTDDRGPKDMGPGHGALSTEQQDWVLDALPKWKKPVFVCSHFPVHELTAGGKPLDRLLLASPNVAGYIHGHDHRWYTKHMRKNWVDTLLKRSLCLPSTGHWGDIGYALMRTDADKAVVTLRQRDFFYPRPEPMDPADRELWKIVVRENQGLSCSFLLPRG